jgi:hypothetical protein
MPCLYPPLAIYLFAPFLILPRIAWWLIPLGVLAGVLARLRPARWAWPFIVAPLATPDFTAGIAAGNTGMWILAGVAGGVEWGWPSLIALLKPFLAPFALVGSRRRTWWIGLAVICALCVPLSGAWLVYPSIIGNAQGLGYDPLTYGPMLLVPIVAWFASDRGHLPSIRLHRSRGLADA